MTEVRDKRIKVLFIEDNPGDVRLIKELLVEAGAGTFALETAGRLAAGLHRLAADDFDVVLLDLGLPDSQGFDTFFKLKDQAPRVPTLVLTGLGDETIAVSAVREGAQDYLVKGQFDGNLLARAIRYAIERKRIEEAVRAANRFLDIANRGTALASALKEFVAEVRTLTGCAAVGIRLLEAEGSNPNQADEAATPRLYGTECPLCMEPHEHICVRVINRMVDRDLPIFTRGGSFHVNAAKQLISTSPQKCMKACKFIAELQYQSVALIPIPVEDRVIGLIHVADPRENMLPMHVVEVLEGVAMQIGVAIQRIRSREEIRRLNEELEQRVIQRTRQLKAANEELESFAYSVSHDLRAPLRGIDGFSRVLLEDQGDNLDEDGRATLERVRAAAQRMGQLIEDLLKLSRAIRAEMQSSPVNLSAMARKIAAELQAAEPERRVHFVIADGLVANGDAPLLRQAMWNLLENSWKFTSKHPDATIEFGAIENEGKTAYFVRDDGAGFDMRYASKLFGAFQRLHSEGEFPGTGIGLATVQRIIHRHGGEVRAEGAVEKGATFYFTLGD